MKSFFKDWKFILLVFALSKAVILFAALAGSIITADINPNSYGNKNSSIVIQSSQDLNKDKLSSNPVLAIWGRWDSGFYNEIANIGYEHSETDNNSIKKMAFFPLFPYITRVGSTITNISPYLVGLILTNVFTLLSMFVIWQLASIWTKNKNSRSAVVLFSLMPSAFYYGAYYPEALFALLVGTSFLAWERKNHLLLAVCLSLAGATRPSGILLIAIFGLCYLHRWSRSKNLGQIARELGYMLIWPIGFIWYLVLNYQEYGNALEFMDIEKNLWGRVASNPLLNLLDYMRHSFAGLLVGVIIITWLLVILYGYKKLPVHVTAWSMIAIILPLASGTPGALRYSLPAISVPLVLTIIADKHKDLKTAMIYTLGVVQAVFVLLWTLNFPFVQ
jgi:Gpi18-like mannosyltransferase